VVSQPEPTYKRTIRQQLAAEAVAPLAAQHDITSAAIRYKQMMEEAERGNEPPRIGRRRW